MSIILPFADPDRPFAVLPGFPAGRQLGYQVGKPSENEVPDAGWPHRAGSSEASAVSRRVGEGVGFVAGPGGRRGGGSPRTGLGAIEGGGAEFLRSGSRWTTWPTGFVAMGGRRSFSARAVMPDGTSHNGKLPVPGGEPVFGVRTRATWRRSWHPPTSQGEKTEPLPRLPDSRDGAPLRRVAGRERSAPAGCPRGHGAYAPLQPSVDARLICEVRPTALPRHGVPGSVGQPS